MGIGLAVAWMSVEAVVVATRLDVTAMQRTLYYQGVLLSLHQPDPDLRLRYRLRPSQSLGKVTIGTSGLRNPTPPDDAPGPRILFGGGSTIFGENVHDEETLPARLSHHLGGAAVWNLGVSAYVESQVLDLTRIWMNQLGSVDLAVVVITNPGRRPFLQGEPMDRATMLQHLSDDPGFSDENLPPPWGDTARGLHQGLLRLSPSWRYVTATRSGNLQRNHPMRDPSIARNLAAQALQDAAQAAGVPIVFVHYPGHRLPCDRCWRGDLELDLTRPGLSSQARDLHPPAAELDAHAAHLAAMLQESGLL